MYEVIWIGLQSWHGLEDEFIPPPLPPPPPLLPLLLPLLLLPRLQVYLDLLLFCRDGHQTILEAWPLVFSGILQAFPSRWTQVLQLSKLQLHPRTAFSCLHKFWCQFCVVLGEHVDCWG